MSSSDKSKLLTRNNSTMNRTNTYLKNKGIGLSLSTVLASSDFGTKIIKIEFKFGKIEPSLTKAPL